MRKYKDLIIAMLLFIMAAATPMSAQRCGAMTVKNEPCKMRVVEIGTKCHHHATTNATTGKNGGSAVIRTCGAKTVKGLPCKRRVKLMGAKCHSHA